MPRYLRRLLNGLLRAVRFPGWELMPHLVLMSVIFFAMRLLHNQALEKLPLSMVQTLKATQPFVAMQVGVHWFKIEYDNYWVMYGSMILTFGGVAMACYSAWSIDAAGVVMSLSSTLLLVVQNFMAKFLLGKSVDRNRPQRTRAKDESLDQSQLVLWNCIIAAVVVLPVWYVKESERFFEFVNLPPEPGRPENEHVMSIGFLLVMNASSQFVQTASYFALMGNITPLS